jgi:UDP-N-acetylglucosamine--N-acetylmuramyl-(pentapeptide) pyrophosphoryl-undecaprenol N-acetylglucosamine transferase
MKIIFSGGGTLGPVTPLLAIKQMVEQAHPTASFLWVGTNRGPEKELVLEQSVRFVTLSSGKFRRYISLWNVIDVGRVIVGFFQSLVLIWKEKPDICISAGGFISVPLHWAAWFMGVPTWVHQQDVRVGLSTRLMQPFARVITTALSSVAQSFSSKKAHWIGNPVRQGILHGDAHIAAKEFNLDPSLPTVFVTGGGTGSMKVNQMVVEALGQLEGIAQVVHLTGKERPRDLIEPADRQFDFYHPFVFFTDQMKHAYAASAMVVSRGGFGTISELAALAKPAIIIPKAGHQEENVLFLEKEHAVIVLDEALSSGLHLAKEIRRLLEEVAQAKSMGLRLQRLLPQAKARDVINILEAHV